jgi:hypothetical protein
MELTTSGGRPVKVMAPEQLVQFLASLASAS